MFVHNFFFLLVDIFNVMFIFSAETAQSALGSDVNDAVITVPFEFGEMQKNALRYKTSRKDVVLL